MWPGEKRKPNEEIKSPMSWNKAFGLMQDTFDGNKGQGESERDWMSEKMLTIFGYNTILFTVQMNCFSWIHGCVFNKIAICLSGDSFLLAHPRCLAASIYSIQYEID